MLVLDVNVVVAAFRRQHPQHGEVREWFDDVLAGDTRLGVPSFVWASFLRLVTSRRVFTVPSARDEAFAFIELTVAQPAYLPAEPGPRHLALLKRLCDEGDATGDLVPDAVLAAVAVECDARVATLDRDFARFPSVRTVRPS